MERGGGEEKTNTNWSTTSYLQPVASERNHDSSVLELIDAYIFI